MYSFAEEKKNGEGKSSEKENVTIKGRTKNND